MNGVIEAEVAGAPGGREYPGARGFVGIAFRLQTNRASDGPQAYDAFYLRPTKGSRKNNRFQ